MVPQGRQPFPMRRPLCRGFHRHRSSTGSKLQGKDLVQCLVNMTSVAALMTMRFRSNAASGGANNDPHHTTEALLRYIIEAIPDN